MRRRAAGKRVSGFFGGDMGSRWNLSLGIGNEKWARCCELALILLSNLVSLANRILDNAVDF